MRHNHSVCLVHIVDLAAVTNDYAVACDAMEITRHPLKHYLGLIMTHFFSGPAPHVARDIEWHMREVGAFDEQNLATDIFTELTIQYLRNIDKELSALGLNFHDDEQQYYVAKCTSEYTVYICSTPFDDHYRSPAVRGHAPKRGA
jgi:hypothetical protein